MLLVEDGYTYERSAVTAWLEHPEEAQAVRVTACAACKSSTFKSISLLRQVSDQMRVESSSFKIVYLRHRLPARLGVLAAAAGETPFSMVSYGSLLSQCASGLNSPGFRRNILL